MYESRELNKWVTLLRRSVSHCATIVTHALAPSNFPLLSPHEDEEVDTYFIPHRRVLNKVERFVQQSFYHSAQILRRVNRCIDCNTTTISHAVC